MRSSALLLAAALLCCGRQPEGPGAEREPSVADARAERGPEAGPTAPEPTADWERPPSEPPEAGAPGSGDAAGPGDEAGGGAPTGRLVAPAELERAVPRLGYPPGELCSNLVYEANNMAMRGSRLPSGLYAATGAEIAGRWRAAASEVRGVFVLRDALFSQQDHALDHPAFALMLPPSWVSVAVAEVLAGRTIAPPAALEVEDDAGWAALERPEQLFGSFPPSQGLFDWARRSRASVGADLRPRVVNARQALRALSEQVGAMIAAAPRGASAVAEAGAERIAESDRRYFGEGLRRARVIPISVENPNQHEIEDEGKGFVVAGRELPPEALRLATAAVLRRRLADGPLALERYDLSRPEERRRAISLLELLIPSSAAGQGGEALWLWVNGPLDARGVTGEDATAFIESFRAELERAAVDRTRLRLLSKPHVELPRGAGRAAALRAAVARFSELDLPLSLNLSTRSLLELWGGR